MKVIAKPKSEETILKPVTPSAKAEEVRKSIVEKAEHCVVHLCGCNCSC